MKKFKLIKEKWYFQSLWETKSVQPLDDWAVQISWYASTKDKDRWWDIVEPHAFASALERYMTNPIVLLQHKADKPIGIVEEASIDDNWLWIKAKISQNTDWVVDLIKNWVLRAFSIGYSIKDYDTDVRELADWSYDMTNIIKDLELYEISVVSVPMNPYALSKSVKDLLEVEENEETPETTENEENENSEKVEENGENPEKCENEEAKDTEKCEEEKKEEAEEETKPVEETHDVEYQAEETADWSIAVEVKEEIPNEEVETQETSEEWSDSEEEAKEAVEETEIEETAVDEDSENVVETTTDEAEVVETHNEEIVETKSMNVDSQKQFDFESKIESLSKSFEEKLSRKDEEIKSLKSKVETMTKLFAESVETIDRMTTAVKNMPINSGLAYKRPLKKWGYSELAEWIKNYYNS